MASMNSIYRFLAVSLAVAPALFGAAPQASQRTFADAAGSHSGNH